MRKNAFCILDKQGADQLSSYRSAYQRLGFHYVDSTSPLKFQASSHLLILYCQVWDGTQQDRFSHEAAQL